MPERVSAIAAPPSSPAYQGSRIALACSAAQFTASALPLASTRTTGFPVAATASSNSSSGFGRSIFVRSPPLNPSSLTGISSPSSSLVIPNTAMTTSAALAAAIASGLGLGSYFDQISCARIGAAFACEYCILSETFLPCSR